MSKMDLRCQEWRLMQMGKRLMALEMTVEDWRDRFAEQGGSGVCPDDEQVPPHSIKFCLKAWGMGPLPMIGVPNLVLAPAVFG
jgi:hypothetical protein